MGVGLCSREGQKEDSGRIEHLSLETSFIEIDPFGASLVHIDDFGMIETEQTEDGGMQVVHVYLVFDRMQAEFVGFPNDLSAFYPATGHPHGEAGRVVVAVTRRGAHTMYGFMYAEVLRARARMRACAGTEIHTFFPTSELRHEIVCNPSDRARVT